LGSFDHSNLIGFSGKPSEAMLKDLMLEPIVEEP
jgi:hypothetical protein